MHQTLHHQIRCSPWALLQWPQTGSMQGPFLLWDRESLSVPHALCLFARHTRQLHKHSKVVSTHRCELCPQAESRLAEGRDQVPGSHWDCFWFPRMRCSPSGWRLLTAGAESRAEWLSPGSVLGELGASRHLEAWALHLGRAVSITLGVPGNWGEGTKVNDFHLQMLCPAYKWGLLFPLGSHCWEDMAALASGCVLPSNRICWTGWFLGVTQ